MEPNDTYAAMLSQGTVTNYKVEIDKPVLVTGATGYVAGVLIQRLLDEGCTVHATVRDANKLKRLQYLYTVADKTPGKIKFFTADLLDEGSFAEAMRGCCVVFHTASPLITTEKGLDPYTDLINPAVQGTENVLTTAALTPSLQRVVLTSSVMAVYGDACETSDAPHHTLTEDNWNRTSTPATAPYPLSKTLAEVKAWEMAGSQQQYTLTTINPGLVLGPGLKVHDSAESYKLMKQFGDGTLKHGAPNLAMGVADVRDVAEAHVAAAFTLSASGRHIVNGHCGFLPDIGKAIAVAYPRHEHPNVPTKALPLPKCLLWTMAPLFNGMKRDHVRNNVDVRLNLDGSKVERELGLQYTPFAQTCRDMFQQMVDAGVFGQKSTSAKPVSS